MKVGDIYTMQWGYEQTNNTFYRVKALRGKTQAVIQEVDLKVDKAYTEGYSPMAADYVYNPKEYAIRERSVFINDNDKGRIIKRQNERWGDPDKPVEGFYIDHHFCRPYKGERVYESWYA